MADDKIDLRPKKRNISAGLERKCEGWILPRTVDTYDDLTRPSTKGAAKPLGLMAGAKAMKTLTLSFNCGCMLSAAKAWAEPWLKPI